MTLTFLLQICVLVAVAMLEECCMSSADMQWLFDSGKQIMAHGPLFHCSLGVGEKDLDFYSPIVPAVCVFSRVVIVGVVVPAIPHG